MRLSPLPVFQALAPPPASQGLASPAPLVRRRRSRLPLAALPRAVEASAPPLGRQASASHLYSARRPALRRLRSRAPALAASASRRRAAALAALGAALQRRRPSQRAARCGSRASDRLLQVIACPGMPARELCWRRGLAMHVCCCHVVKIYKGVCSPASCKCLSRIGCGQKCDTKANKCCDCHARQANWNRHCWGVSSRPQTQRAPATATWLPR